jgi:acetyl esterase/lipase
LEKAGVPGGQVLVAPVIVAHVTLETPEFQRQNREFAAAVNAAGNPVTFIVLEAYHHFEVPGRRWALSNFLP